MSQLNLTRAGRIEAKLAAAFAPLRLIVLDESAQHAGHSGARPGGETHYRVTVVSEAFRDQKRVDRSRTVHAALADEFEHGLHALALTLMTPEEETARGS
jgi:BolA protein